MSTRRILVTGGATGIGAGGVQVLSEAGAAVVATYHRTPPPSQDGVTWVQCDVRDSAAVDQMVNGAAEKLGGLDVLLHAAGMWQPGIPGQISGEDIDFLVDTNLKATIFTNQAAYAVMRKDGGGRIIKLRVGRGGDGQSDLGPVRHDQRSGSGLDALGRQGVGAEKVSVIALAPAVKTPGADRLREFLGPEAADFIDEQIKATIPLGGALGDPVNDLGPTLVFLCSEGSRFITGQLIAVDGGLVMLGA
jgi:3-oxoacyl-[acyl-carrier protein] reductase